MFFVRALEQMIIKMHWCYKATIKTIIFPYDSQRLCVEVSHRNSHRLVAKALSLPPSLAFFYFCARVCVCVCVCGFYCETTTRTVILLTWPKDVQLLRQALLYDPLADDFMVWCSSKNMSNKQPSKRCKNIHQTYQTKGNDSNDSLVGGLNPSEKY